MPLDWEHLAAIAGFTTAGGWLAARTTSALTGRVLSTGAAMAACFALGMWAYHVVFGTTGFLLSLCLAWGLLVLAVVDWRDYRLPDVITLPLAAMGLGSAVLLPAEHVLDHAGAAAGAFAVLWGIGWGYKRLRGKEGMGLGDAKLAAAAGAWLGAEPLPSVLLLASVSGIVWILMSSAIRGRAQLEKRIPFGVPLTASIWIVWLYGSLVLL